MMLADMLSDARTLTIFMADARETLSSSESDDLELLLFELTEEMRIREIGFADKTEVSGATTNSAAL